MFRSKFLLVCFFSISAHSATLPDGRSNVMECTHDEVVAYMGLPDAERQALMNYQAWEKAYQSAEVKKAEDDPAACIGILYGDLQDMADRVKKATEGLMEMTLGGLLESLGDKLMEGICSRVEVADTTFRDNVLKEADKMEKKAREDIDKRYGIKAMEKYVNEAIDTPEYKSEGLEFRNGKVSEHAFRDSVKQRWAKELRELEESSSGG